MKKQYKKSLVLAVLFIAFFIACGGSGGGDDPRVVPEPPPPPPAEKADWTIIAYLDGNIDLDAAQGINASFILDELHDLEEIGSLEDKVEIVALYASIKENGVGRCYHIEYYPNEAGDNLSSPTIAEMGTVDMSDYRTLRDLINLAVEQYPAEKYIFLGTGHGGGWRGVFTDEIQDSRPYGMSMDELTQAITESDLTKFDIMIFNACLMSMVEVGYQLRNLTDYIVASQVSLSADNVLGFGEWLKELVTYPESLSTEEVAKAIALASYNEVRSRNIGDDVVVNHSISVLKTDADAFEAFADKWMELHNAIVDMAEQYYVEMFLVRAEIHDSGLDRRDYIDVILYLDELGQQPNISATPKYAELIAEMSAILKEDIRVVHYNNLRDDTRRGGIAVYFPVFCDDNTETDQDLYEQVDFGELTGWGDHAKLFVEILYTAFDEISCPHFGVLEIDSTPQGAWIFLNNIDQEVFTPQTFVNVSSGSYIVKLTLEGYQDWVQTVPVIGGQINTVNATMEPISEDGTLEIDSTPQGARIYINNIDQGRVTPFTFTDVPAGSYTVRLTLEGYDDWEQTVQITAGQTTQVNALFEVSPDQTGMLAINSTPPGAMIFINGYDQEDVTPMTYTGVPVGTNTVMLTLEGYEDWETSVQVAAGQTTTVNATMVPEQSAIDEQEPNDNLNQAQLIQVPCQVTGSAREGDAGLEIPANPPLIVEDWYRFNVAAPSQISIGLSTNNIADFDFYLFDADGVVIEQCISTGNGDESATVNLSSGNYFLGVNAYENTANVTYTLTLSQ